MGSGAAGGAVVVAGVAVEEEGPVDSVAVSPGAVINPYFMT